MLVMSFRYRTLPSRATGSYSRKTPDKEKPRARTESWSQKRHTYRKSALDPDEDVGCVPFTLTSLHQMEQGRLHGVLPYILYTAVPSPYTYVLPYILYTAVPSHIHMYYPIYYIQLCPPHIHMYYPIYYIQLCPPIYICTTLYIIYSCALPIYICTTLYIIYSCALPYTYVLPYILYTALLPIYICNTLYYYTDMPSHLCMYYFIYYILLCSPI